LKNQDENFNTKEISDEITNILGQSIRIKNVDGTTFPDLI